MISGCASIPDAPKEVRIPYPVACLESADIPAKPEFRTDSELAKMSDADLILSLRSNDLERQKYLPVIEALLQNCIK